MPCGDQLLAQQGVGQGRIHRDVVRQRFAVGSVQPRVVSFTISQILQHPS